MYANELVVGARSLAAVEEALRLALPSLGLAVREAIDVANVSELWERRKHEPSIAIGPVSDGIFAISVRGPRAPTWNNELSRRLSQLLGGWAACCVNDRLLDDYGYGYFLDGLTIEAASRSSARLVERTGLLRETPDRVLLDSLDEERNQRHFRHALERIAGPYVSAWPPTGAIRVLFVEGNAITVSELARPPSTLIIAAGHDERIELPGYEYDVVVGDEDVRVLLARTHLPLWEIAEQINRVTCAAVITDGADTYVRVPTAPLGADFACIGLRLFLQAWEPVCARTQTSPMAFTFDAVRPTSPWR